jgi:hypothetical protein
MMDSRINGQSDRRAIWPRMCDHFTAPLHRVRFILLADEYQGRRRHRCRRDVTEGVIGDHRTKPLCEKLRGRVVIHGVERCLAAHRLAEDGHPRRIDEVELRQVAECRVDVERLLGQSSATTVRDADDTRAEAVDGKGHVPQELSRSAITAECPNMPLQPCNTTTAGYGAPPLEGPPSSADKPESGRAR